MHRQQISFVVVLGLLLASPLVAAENMDEGANTSAADESSTSTLTGKLYHNAADRHGMAPYVLMDQWGVVRGYVAPVQGLELEQYLGQSIKLEGTVKDLPGGDMPYLTAEHVLVGHKPSRAPASRETAALAPLPVTTHRSGAGLVQPAAFQEVVDAPVTMQPAPLAPQTSHTVNDPIVSPQPESIPMPYPSASTPYRGRMSAGYAHPTVEAEEEGVEPSSIGPGCGGSCQSGGCETGMCDSCGESSCDACCRPYRKLFCFGPTGIWVDADYLLWTLRGENTPPLVTSGPPTLNDGVASTGHVGDPTTTILFGGDKINDQMRSGGRLQVGAWLNACQTFGIEGEYVGLQDESAHYYQWSDGNPVIARPFFNVTGGTQASELVAFPRGSAQSLDGSITVDARTSFNSAGARFLFGLCRQESCWSDPCFCGLNYHDSFKSNLELGYRHLNLQDTLGVTEALTSTSGTIPGTETTGTEAFLINDSFATQNDFNGGEIGLQMQFKRNRWSWEFLPKIAIGNTHESVDINGSTRITNADGSHTGPMPGGLLTSLNSNIGSYSKDIFGVVPELDTNIGYQITPHATLKIGYTFIYWNQVVRAGDQIDFSVDPGNTFGSTTGTTNHPAFAFQQSSFWAQGVNFGLDLRW